MNSEKNMKNAIVKKEESEPFKKSLNELPVLSIDPKLSKWVKIIRPTKSSLHTERME